MKRVTLFHIPFPGQFADSLFPGNARAAEVINATAAALAEAEVIANEALTHERASAALLVIWRAQTSRAIGDPAICELFLEHANMTLGRVADARLRFERQRDLLNATTADQVSEIAHTIATDPVESLRALRDTLRASVRHDLRDAGKRVFGEIIRGITD